MNIAWRIHTEHIDSRQYVAFQLRMQSITSCLCFFFVFAGDEAKTTKMTTTTTQTQNEQQININQISRNDI